MLAQQHMRANSCMHCPCCDTAQPLQSSTHQEHDAHHDMDRVVSKMSVLGMGMQLHQLSRADTVN